MNEASGSFRGLVVWETPDHGRYVLPCPGSHGLWPLFEEKDSGSRLSILFESVERHRAHALRLSPFSENQGGVGACAREASGPGGSPKVAMVESCGSSPCKRPAEGKRSNQGEVLGSTLKIMIDTIWMEK